MKEIIMFYTKTCLNAKAMIPVLIGINLTGAKFKFIFMDIGENESMRMKEKFINEIEDTGEKNSIPMFVDKKAKKAFYASNVEDLMTWLEPNWWKKEIF